MLSNKMADAMLRVEMDMCGWVRRNVENNPRKARLGSIPVSIMIVISRTLRPLIIVVESVALLVINTLGTIFNVVKETFTADFRYRNTKLSLSHAAINIEIIISSTANAAGRVLTSPIHLISQFYSGLADPAGFAPAGVTNFR